MSLFPRSVLQYLERRFEQYDFERTQRIGKIRTEAAAREYISACRTDIKRIYSLPSEKTPLNTRITGTLEHETYRIEKLLFESRPGLLVSANLYIPKGPGPFPCVLGACGHSQNGKAEAKYQSFCAGLASKGFLTLIYDPIGQGERHQFPEHREELPGCVDEHVALGTRMSLTGSYFGSWRAWDGIRAVDVLLERPEADPNHLGVTGNSGGGTMTTVLAALEDRLTMICPSCFITTYRHNLENELPSDTEQVPPGIIQKGYEQYDHLISAAPRPILLLTKEDDFFDQRGSREAYRAVRNFYENAGYPGRVEIVTGAGGHGFDLELRESMYGFFLRHVGSKADIREPDIQIHDEDELYAAPNGSVMNAKSRTVMSFLADSLCEMRLNGSSETEFSVSALSKLLGVSDLPVDPPEYRVLRTRNGASRIAVQTEDAIFCIVSHRIPDSRFRLPSSRRAVLYLPHVDESADLETDTPVYEIHVRGTGESKYDICGGSDYFALYDADYFVSSYLWMMGIPMAGRRVFDLLRTIQLLKSAGLNSIELHGRGCGALIALYTSPFIEGLERLVLREYPRSLEEIVRSDVSKWPQSVLVPGILQHFDLPNIVAALENSGVTVQTDDPWKPDFTSEL